MQDNGFFMKMCKDAQDELASGAAGTNWRDIDTNTLLMAAFGMLFNHMTSKIVRPLWFFAGSVATGIIGYLIKQFLG